MFYKTENTYTYSINNKGSWEVGKDRLNQKASLLPVVSVCFQRCESCRNGETLPGC